MGEIERLVEVVEAIARKWVPGCFEVRAVELSLTERAVQDLTPFAVVVRIARRSADPEPAGWIYSLTADVRQRWARDDFQIIVREEP